MPTRNILTLWDWLSIALYAVVMVLLAMRFHKRQQTTDHYFTASGRIPGWAAGVSMFATLLSSFTFVAFPGWTYEKSMLILTREMMAPIAVGLCAFMVIPLYRHVIRMSAYEYLERRFGYSARLYGSAGFFIGHIFKLGVVMFAMAQAVSAITGWPIVWIIVIFGAITVAYTLVGGIEGVVWTDVVQGGMMLGAGIITVLYILFFSGVSVGEVLSTAQNAGKFEVVNTHFSWQDDTMWVFMWFGMYHFLSRYTTDQTMVQRYLLSPTIKDAVRGTMIGIGCCVLAWLLFTVIGALLFSYYQIHPERLGSHITKGDQVFPYFIATQLPPIITGFVIAALIAATLDTLSSDINSAGSCVISDYYDRFARNPTEATRLRISQISTGCFGVFAVFIGVLLTYYDGGIVKLTLELAGIMGAIIAGGLLAAFLLGMFVPRVGSKSLYAGIFVATAFSTWMVGCSRGWWLPPAASRDFLIGLNPLWLPPFSNIVAFVVAWGTSFIFISPRAPSYLTYEGAGHRNMQDTLSVRSENISVVSPLTRGES